MKFGYPSSLILTVVLAVLPEEYMTDSSYCADAAAGRIADLVGHFETAVLMVVGYTRTGEGIVGVVSTPRSWVSVEEQEEFRGGQESVILHQSQEDTEEGDLYGLEQCLQELQFENCLRL
jgi:hypothetical protein